MKEYKTNKMITIPVSELKRFLSAAKNILPNNMLPIYDYVKLVCKDGKATLYKSNGHSYLICPISANFKEDAAILLEEATVAGFVNFCVGDNIEIKVAGKKVNFTDGVKKVSHQEENAGHYIAINEEKGERYVLGSDVLSAIYSAKAHVKQPVDKAIREWQCFVHVTKGDNVMVVGGFNGVTTYVQKFKEKLPTMVLEPSVIEVIGKQNAVTYSSVGNYDVFEINDMVYGFVKAEQKAQDYTSVLLNFKKAIKHFTFNKSDLTEFCQMVISIHSKSSIKPEVEIAKGEGAKAKLSYYGLNEKQAHEEIDIEDYSDFETYKFQPSLVLLALKDVPHEKVMVTNLRGCFVLSTPEDESYLGCVMALSN